MRLELVLAFWAVTMLLLIVPGPDWAFVLASAARDRVVMPAVGGLVIGYLLLTLVVAAGVGGVVARSEVMLTVLTVLTVIGTGYLCFVGVSLLRRPAAVPVLDPSGKGRSGIAVLRRGVGVSGLNPKGLLIFLALMPQFCDSRGSWPAAVQLTVLGLVFVLSCGGFYTVLGAGASWMVDARPSVTLLVSRLSGAAMVALGLALLVERLIPFG